MKKIMMNGKDIRPSQLYLNQGKLKKLKKTFHPNDPNNPPLPVKQLDGDVFFTDGHTCAFLYDCAGINEIPV